MAGQQGVEEEDVHPVRINKELSYLRPCFVAQGKIDHLHITAASLFGGPPNQSTWRAWSRNGRKGCSSMLYDVTGSRFERNPWQIYTRLNGPPFNLVESSPIGSSTISLGRLLHGKYKQTSVLASCVLIENYYFMFFKDLMQCLSLPFPHSNHL